MIEQLNNLLQLGVAYLGVSLMIGLIVFVILLALFIKLWIDVGKR